jgi:1,2-diacylglycerol 3-beta-galactosyltransferase
MVESTPPRILFVFAPLGGGHSTVVRALSEACQELPGPEVEVAELNIFSNSCSRFPLTFIPWLYRFFTVNQPWLWRTLYHMTNSPARFALAEWLAQPFLQTGLRDYLAQWQPDVVIPVFPALGRSITRALASIGSTAPIVTVITDLVTVHPAWICTTCAAYVVATPEAADTCALSGIPRERIRLYGLPVSSEFLQSSAHRAELRRRLGLDNRIPTVLLMGGAEGNGHLEYIVYAFASAGCSLQLVVITGRNKALRQRLASRQFALPCTILGYVENVKDWMVASDLLITKAGPMTVMEALHSAIPIIVTGSLPQESGTIGYLLRHGAARFAAHPSDIVATSLQLLSQPEQLEALRRNGEALHRRDATQDIATFLWEITRRAVRAT